MAGISAGSDGVNAVGAEPPEPSFASAGSSALWIRIAAPFWVGVSEMRNALERRLGEQRADGAEDPALVGQHPAHPGGEA